MLQRTNLNLTNNLVSVLLLLLAMVVASAMVWLGQSGGLDMVVFVSVGAVVTIALLSSLEFGLMALIFVAAADGFLKGLSPGWHTQLLKDYVLAMCLLRWAWLSVLGHRRESMRYPLSLPIILFIGWVTVQLFNSRGGGLIVGLAGLRMWTIWLPTFLLAYDTLRTRAQVERMLLFIFALLTPIAIYGIVQYYIGMDHLFDLAPGFRVYQQAQYAGSVGNEWRPPGTFVSPHAFSGTLTMVALMGAGLIGYFKRNRILQLFLMAAVPLMAVATLITAVRNAAASIAIGVLALLILVRRLDLAILTAIVGAIAISQVGAITGGEALDRIQSIVANPQYTRHRVLGTWQSAIKFTTRKPLGHGISTGVGLGRTARLQGISGPLNPETSVPWIENEYGRAAVELGVPGFLLFIWMLYSVASVNLRSYRSAIEQRDRWLLAGIFAAVVSMFARLLVGSALYGPGAIFFWYYIAIAARLPQIEEQEMLRRQAPSTEARAMTLGRAQLPWARNAERDQ